MLVNCQAVGGPKAYRLSEPLTARAAEEMAQIPTYYVMEKDKGMAATVAPHMPPADYITYCEWLTREGVGNGLV